MKWKKVEPVSELRKMVFKPQTNYRSPWYSRKITRKISVYFTWLFLHTNITANQVTLLQNLVGFLGFFLLCCPHIGWSLLGIVMIQLGFILDNSDGEIARYRKTTSVNGIFMDFFNHVTVVPLIPAGLGFHYYHVSGHSLLYPILGIIGGIFALSPINLARNETILYLMEKRKTPSYDYRHLRKGVNLPPDVEIPSGNIPDSDEPGFKKLIKKCISYWGYAVRYPGLMNVASLFILAELFLRDKNEKILPFLFIFYIVVSCLREIFIFSRSVMNHDAEQRYLQIYEGFQTIEPLTKQTKTDEKP